MANVIILEGEDVRFTRKISTSAGRKFISIPKEIKALVNKDEYLVTLTPVK